MVIVDNAPTAEDRILIETYPRSDGNYDRRLTDVGFYTTTDVYADDWLPFEFVTQVDDVVKLVPAYAGSSWKLSL